MFCKDCYFWDSDDKECLTIVEMDSIDRVEGDFAGMRVHVYDDSGLDVRFHTGPLFHCGYFKER